jgi:hypothetical protein
MGALPSTNLSISQIAQELVNVGSYSLRALSANAGKSTPDGMSEFRGYQLPTGTVLMNQNVGGLYDGCSMSMDSWGWFEGTDPNFGGISAFGGDFTYNTEGRVGTFITFGGSSSSPIHGRTNVSVHAASQGYGASPCQPIYSYINYNGSRVNATNTNSGYTEIIYTFTVNPGDYITLEIGLNYGSV